MSTEWFSIGPAPLEEECAQVGNEGYLDLAKIECRVFLNMLTRVLKPTIRLSVMAHLHDSGTYHEVACHFDPNDEAQEEEMLRLERETPGEWDEQAKVELALELSRLQARHAGA